MPIDMAIYGLLTVPIGLLALALLLVSPIYGLVRFRRPESKMVRLHAVWLLVAWLCSLTVLVFYFRSGMWYQEHSQSRHVSMEDLLVAAGFLIIGVVLPGLPFLRLLELRKR